MPISEKKADIEKSKADRSNKAMPEGYVIVMADDNIEDHTQIKTATRECGVNHVFTSVFNGIQLMDLLLKRGAYFSNSRGTPDLVIMDIKLKLLDGFEVLRQIKTNEELKHIPVYILTKDRLDDEVEKAMALGATDYFKKPLKYEEVHQLVKGICDLHFAGKKDDPKI